MSKTRADSVQPPVETDDLAILDSLVEGEDEFDVDLMACGCRLAPTTKMNLGIADMLRLFDLDDDMKTSLIGSLVDEAGIEPDKLLELMDKVSRGDLKEISLDVNDRVTIER